MTIHYENYKRFSRGQGFIGAACRPQSGQARTERWFACDCPACKATLVGRRVVSRIGEVGTITDVHSGSVTIEVPSALAHVLTTLITMSELDRFWAPMPSTEEIFGPSEASEAER